MALLDGLKEFMDTGLVRHYSGNESVEFWRAVNRCPNREVYTLGCILQDVESRVLSAIEQNQPAEKKRTATKVRKAKRAATTVGAQRKKYKSHSRNKLQPKD